MTSRPRRADAKLSMHAIAVWVARLGLCLAFSMPGVALADPPSCQLTRIASLDARTERDGRISVPVTIENHPANLVVDIGAAFSTLDKSFAKSVGLTPKDMHGGTVILGGGIRLGHFVTADSFKIGPLSSKKITFVSAPSEVLVAESMGMLGTDIMANYDIDIDFANEKLGLFSQDHCAGKVVYWTTGAVGQVPISLNKNRHIIVPVTIDGKQVTAMVDSGAARSFMNFKAAKEILGIDEQNPALKSLGQRHMNGIAEVAAYRYPFTSLTFQDVEVQNPDIEIIKYADAVHQEADLVIGVSILRQLHVYIAYGEKVLYVTPAEAH